MKMLALLVLCSGCFVLPKTRTTTRVLGTETGDFTHGAVRKLALTAALRDDTIDVTAATERTCTRPIYRITEIKKEKHASYRGNRDARAGLFALVLAPITIPVTAIGTGVALLADGDGEATEVRTPLRTETLACTTAAADVAVEVVWPSGAIAVETTNADGIARVRIPDTEPYEGVVKIVAPAAQTELRYALAMPGVTAVRETVLACSVVHQIAGAVKVEVDVDVYGRAKSVGVDLDDKLFSRCVSDGVAKTRFSDAHRASKLVLPFELRS